MKCKPIILGLLCTSILACGAKPGSDEGDDTGAGAEDADNDGYTSDVDCDDSDAATYPDADEVCDGVDNDCDDEVDEDAVDATTTYGDADGDGYGDPNAENIACEHPEGNVEDNTDCDDDKPFVNPGATEICDDLDNDCDASTNEDGLASFLPDSGNLVDLGSDLKGSAGSPVQHMVSEKGELRFCGGTYFVNLEVAHSATVVGTGAGPSDVVLDGAANGSTLKMLTDGVDFSVSNLTLTNGTGELAVLISGEELMGGGLLCHSTDENSGSVGASRATLENVIVENNSAYHGAGVLSVGCELDISDSVIRSNTSGGVAGGVGAFSASGHSFSNVSIENNSAVAAGAFYFWNLDPDGTVHAFNLDEVTVSGNESEEVAGGAILGLDTIWSGSTSTGSGVTGNIAPEGPALAVYSGNFDTTDVDFGASGSADDNAPFDLEYQGLDSDYNLGDDITMSCDSEGICGTETDHVLSTADQSWPGGDEEVLGNVFSATSGGTIETVVAAFSTVQYMDNGTCSARPYLLSSAATPPSGGGDLSWDIVKRGSSEDVDTSDSVTMHLGGLVEEGKYYAVVTQLDCSGSATAQIGVTMGATAVNLGLGDVVGLVYDTGSPGTIPSSGTVMLDFWDGNFAGYGMTLGISDL